MQSLNSPTQSSWERLPNEKARAYRAFCIFRDLGEDRSQDKAYALDCAQRGKKPTKAPGYWSKWSTKYTWVERAGDYDDWLDDEKRAATAERIRKLQERRCLFAVENQERLENQVRSIDLLLQIAYKTSLDKVTHTKTDKVTGTETVREIGGLDMGDLARLLIARNKAAELAIRGVDAKEREEEEPQVDRVVWAKAPNKPDPPKDSDPDMPDHSGPGNAQLISELDTSEEDSEEKKAA